MNNRVTVVIPTLGSPSVVHTVAALNSGSVAPDKILLCVPLAFAHRLAQPLPANTRVVETEAMGQVAQRLCGFLAADTEFVMQLDDDIDVSPTCLELLVRTLENATRPACIAPRLVDPRQRNVARDHGRRHPGYRLLYWICNGKTGYKASTVMKCGFNCPFPADGVSSRPFRTEWLPGGSVLHRKKDLVLSSFYPFRGKAYCEDLIHSHALTSAGVSLYLQPAAEAYYEYENSYDLRPIRFFTYVFHDLRARRYFVRLSRRSTIRMCLYYLFVSFNYWKVFLSRRMSRALR